MTIGEMYQQSLVTYQGELKAAKHVLDILPESLFDELCELAEQATFERRRYGSQWYTWAYHPLLSQPRDPWPANRYPKALLCIELGKERTI